MSEHIEDHTGLDRDGYRRLVRAAATPREEIVVRLAGEAGLRPTDIAALTPGDIESRDWDGTTYFFARVGSGEDGRLAYLPADLASTLQTYVAESGRGSVEPILDISSRRIQMLVREVADRATADTNGREPGAVSSRDLRRFHARSLLDRGIDPRVVSETTAWSRLETLAESSTPCDMATIMRSFADVDSVEAAGAAGGDSDVRHSPLDADGGRLAVLVDHIVELGLALTDASTRETIEQQACDTLATVYEYAWIARESSNDGIVVRRRSPAGPADNQDGDLALPPNPVRRVTETGEPVVEDRDRRAPDGECRPGARVLVPLVHGDTPYGVLAVGVRDDPAAVSARERRLLSDVGRRLGQAIAAVERRRLLLADTVLRLSFRCTDTQAMFVRLSSALDCTFSLSDFVPGDNGSFLAFVWLEGADPDSVVERTTGMEAVDSARVIRDTDDGALVEFVLTDGSPALTLVERGGSLTELTASAGRGTLTAEFVPDVDVRDVVQSVVRAFPDTEIITKREVERSVQTDTEFRQALDDILTDKQRSALRAAHRSGYFDWPRESTAEELAESLGVSSPTFHNHLRRAQGKLLSTYLGDGDW